MSSSFVQVTRLAGAHLERARLELEDADRGGHSRLGRRGTADPQGEDEGGGHSKSGSLCHRLPSAGRRPALRSSRTPPLRGWPKLPDFRGRTASGRTLTAFQRLRPRRGSDTMRAFRNRYFDGWPRLAGPGGVPPRRGGGPCPRSASSGSCSLARPPADLLLGPGAPAAHRRGRNPGHRVRRPHPEPGARAAAPRGGQRPDRAGGRAPRGRPPGDQHRDR